MSNINLDELLAQRAEATGAEEGRIPFDYKGQTFTFKDPILLDDEDLDELEECETGPEVAEFYLGEEQYDAFLDAGGTSNLFFLAFNQYTQEAQSELEGKNSRGNRSSRRKAARARKR